MASFFFVAGFGLVFEWYWMGIVGLIGVFITLIIRSFDKNEGYYVSEEEIKETERLTV